MNLLVPDSGTVYTPDSLAVAMVNAAGDAKTAAWLDPCVGEGAFVRALSAMGVPRRRIVAIDLDRRPSPSDALAETVRGADFISWSQGTPARFDRIVANPPYVALNRIDQSLLRAALALQIDGELSLRLKANYWCAFVVSALRLIAPGGNLCMVLPAAWDYADYAVAFRTKLPLRFRTFEVYRSREPLFGPVQDGCVVIVGRGFGEATIRSQRFEFETTEKLSSALRGVERHTCVSSSTVYFSASAPSTEKRVTRQFNEAFELRIGAVTGDAKFFLLTESERLERGLPMACLQRCVTRAGHLSSAEATTKSWETLRKSGARIWLFRPPQRLLEHPAVAAYLKLPHACGGCDRTRFKVFSRDPWHRSELPARVEGFLSGMSRVGPWICLRRDERLTATNTLYTVRFRLANTWEERAAWAICLFAPEVRRQLLTKGRRYPDGLLKYEPGDLHDLTLPAPVRKRGALARYRALVRTFLAQDRAKFDLLISDWFGYASTTLSAPAVPLRLASW
jgi:adenine-specific DNA-methyltransferase